MTKPEEKPVPSIQQPPEHKELEENGPFNPPQEFVQVTRGKRGGIVPIVTVKKD